MGLLPNITADLSVVKDLVAVATRELPRLVSSLERLAEAHETLSEAVARQVYLNETSS